MTPTATGLLLLFIIVISAVGLGFVIGHSVGYVRAMRYAGRKLDDVIRTVGTRS